MTGKKGGPPQFGLRPCEDRKQIYNRKKEFEKLDTDGDGNVSAHEYDGLQKMFKELDTDGDGFA
jgi:Ca2+-binding EF-hand superfamily protein